jgi:glycosyltransferase involved in cell wall biosynthesis
MDRNRENFISLILPVFNEELTLVRVISEVRKTKVDEILVINDGSTDRSFEIAKRATSEDARIRIVSHAVNQGLGAARRTGLLAARGNIIAYLDTDIQNPRPQMIDTLLAPLLDHRADFAISSFENEGRVTELTVKPLLYTCFPALAEFNQPISGQFAARRAFLFPDQMDEGKTSIGILIDAYLAGARIIEVDIGTLIHSKREIGIKKMQAREECRACIKRFVATLAVPLKNKGSPRESTLYN